MTVHMPVTLALWGHRRKDWWNFLAAGLALDPVRDLVSREYSRRKEHTPNVLLWSAQTHMDMHVSHMDSA